MFSRDRAAEQEDVLEHHRDAPAQLGLAQLAQVDAVEQDRGRGSDRRGA